MHTRNDVGKHAILVRAFEHKFLLFPLFPSSGSPNLQISVTKLSPYAAKLTQ